MITDDADVRYLLGLPELPTRCPCRCGHKLIPAGTRVRHARYGKGKVATWSAQDHWNVPITFPENAFVILPFHAVRIY